jgi:hypothetical protein
MYVAPPSDKDWLRKEQRKLYERSQEQPDYVFHKLWGLMTDSHNLRIAVERVARNRGACTAGVVGLTARSVPNWGQPGRSRPSVSLAMRWAHTPGLRGPIDGEPGAERKPHAGFGERHSETDPVRTG